MFRLMLRVLKLERRAELAARDRRRLRGQPLYRGDIRREAGSEVSGRDAVIQY